MSIRLYVGNLPKSDVERDELQTVFADAGDLVSVKVIKDRKTGKCRGFGFVTVETDEQADQIIEKYNGAMFQELPIKIEKALPKAKGQDDEDGESSDSTEPREPSTVPKPNLSNKGNAGSTSTPRRSNGSGGSKKGGRKEGAKSTTNNNNNTYASSTNTDSFQPDPRWAGKLAELKDKLAQSGNL
ncbi:RNA recognition motif domain-containing protein [Chamaesiphon polymorphus]|jgi:RNA recognition motif-containing protein|uniref:RNA-binding protein n=1 Tax=Chamaesiphon polymorphus CCALA 037 TaxID=2107692 RepID=A0A2T1GK06_9CYAN|nr:RNA-binding protein [Chamaesiphon polymorphus]PSB58159.1 RNA-binding protein [Chamaesiphon polymorphus CCALA 037]